MICCDRTTAALNELHEMYMSYDAVLAYDKNVPESGGPVLMTDGNVQEMTAQEFKETRKGKG